MFSKSKLEFRSSLSLLTWALLMAYSKATATESFPVSDHSDYTAYQTNVCLSGLYSTFHLTFVLPYLVHGNITLNENITQSYLNHTFC